MIFIIIKFSSVRSSGLICPNSSLSFLTDFLNLLISLCASQHIHASSFEACILCSLHLCHLQQSRPRSNYIGCFSCSIWFPWPFGQVAISIKHPIDRLKLRKGLFFWISSSGQPKLNWSPTRASQWQRSFRSQIRSCRIFRNQVSCEEYFSFHRLSCKDRAYPVHILNYHDHHWYEWPSRLALVECFSPFCAGRNLLRWDYDEGSCRCVRRSVWFQISLAMKSVCEIKVLYL